MINHHSGRRKAQMLRSLPVRLKSQEIYVEHEVMRASKASGDKSADAATSERSGVCLTGKSCENLWDPCGKRFQI